MPVYITDTDALGRIMQVECEHMSDSERRQFQEEQLEVGMCSFEGFRRVFEQIPKLVRNADPRGRITVDCNAAIYGAGGFNRYFVRNTGEIEFSKAHSSPQSEELARRAGFTIF